MGRGLVVSRTPFVDRLSEENTIGGRAGRAGAARVSAFRTIRFVMQATPFRGKSTFRMEAIPGRSTGGTRGR